MQFITVRIFQQYDVSRSPEYATLTLMELAALTRSSAVAEGQRDAISQLKSYQVLHNSVASVSPLVI